MLYNISKVSFLCRNPFKYAYNCYAYKKMSVGDFALFISLSAIVWITWLLS